MCLEEDIKVVKIGAEKEGILKNLVSLYLHDLSEFSDDLKVNQEGKFEYEGLNYYFTEKELNPFLIYCNDEISGFVLLNSGKYVPGDAQYSIHEIFILKSFRRKGVAASAIKKIFEIYKGKYKVEQLQDNKLAINFWRGFYKKENIIYKEETEVIDGFNVYTQFFNIKNL